MLTRAQARWIEADTHGAAQLASLVSLASLVDPGLLRAARVALQLPVSAELELRCSPLVSSSGVAGLVLADEALPALRERLDAQTLDLAWQLTRARHAAVSPALELEETLTWAFLRGREGAEAEAELKLNRALVSIVRDNKAQLAGWAARALPRLPQGVRALRSARYLASAVQANGYRTSSALAVDGPPPAWMLASQGPVSLPGSVTLYEATLAINYPARAGEAVIPLPENRRVWISWWQAQQRVWTERTVPRDRTLIVNVEGSEITIEAPDFARVVIQDQAARRIELASFGDAPSIEQRELAQVLRDRLTAQNLVVAQASTTSPGPAADYLLIVAGEPLNGSEKNLLDAAIAGCRSVIFVQTAGSAVLPPFVGLAPMRTIDCRDRARWSDRIEEAVELILGGRPLLAELHDVPEVAPAFVLRLLLLAELQKYLQVSPLQITVKAAPAPSTVNLFGAAGSGRNMTAAQLVRSCVVRRRFTGGIFWLHDDYSEHDDWWREIVPHPCLLIIEDPPASAYAMYQQQTADFDQRGSCLLLLSEKSVTSYLSASAVDGGAWSALESLALFKKAVSLNENQEEIDKALRLVGATGYLTKDPSQQFLFNLMPARSVANLGWLAGMTVRSGESPQLDVDEYWRGETPLAIARQRVVFELDLVKPFAACPLNWRLPDAGEPIWLRYFAPAYQARIGEAHALLAQAFPEPEISESTSRSLFELARPTHSNIVASYREQCGGDWAICADDGYFLEYFAWHFKHAHPASIAELTENMDWLLRAGAEVPGWRAQLDDGSFSMMSSRSTFLGQPSVNLSLEFFAFGGTQPGSSAGDSSYTPGYETQRMAGARLRLRNGEPVRWILVVGTRADSIEPMVAWLSASIGRELARWGYGLLTDGAPGVVAVAEKAYGAQLETNNIPVSIGLRDAVELVEYAAEPVQQGGAQPEEGSSNNALIDRADAVVVIGGGDETLEVWQLALRNERPVIALGGSGGAAQTIAAGMANAPESEVWSTLQRPLESTAVCYEIAQALIKVLAEQPEVLREQPKTFSEPA